MDNANDNDTCIKFIADAFGLDNGWVAQSRLRCLGHIINLVVKALVFGKGVSKLERELQLAGDNEAFKIWSSKGPIGKAHNICVYINRNDARRQEFRLCVQEGMNVKLTEVKNLLIDGGIRWNSISFMIDRCKSCYCYLRTPHR